MPTKSFHQEWLTHWKEKKVMYRVIINWNNLPLYPSDKWTFKNNIQRKWLQMDDWWASYVWLLVWVARFFKSHLIAYTVMWYVSVLWIACRGGEVGQEDWPVVFRLMNKYLTQQVWVVLCIRRTFYRGFNMLTLGSQRHRICGRDKAANAIVQLYTLIRHNIRTTECRSE